MLILKILFTGLSFVLLFVSLSALMVRTQKFLAVKNTREHHIKLSNHGNFTGTFILSVKWVEQRISFKFFMNDIPLVAISGPEYFPPSIPNPAPVGTVSQPKAGTNSAMNTALKSGKSVAAKAGWMASLLGTLGALLPGSLGSSLRTQSEVLRETQSMVITTTQSPVNAQRRLDALQQQSGKISGGNQTAGKTENGSAYRSDPAEASSHSGGTRSGLAEDPIPGLQIVQTKPVEPGEDISVILRIEPVKRHHPEGTFAYTVTSQQFPVEPLEVDPPIVTKTGVLHLPHVEVWRYWLAPAANLLLVFMFLFILFFIFKFIWFR